MVYAQSNPLEPEGNYPAYHASQGGCAYDRNYGVGRVSVTYQVGANSVGNLAGAVNGRPVSVLIEAD